MKTAEAKQILDEHGFIPGQHSTRGLPPEVRGLIKMALFTLAREASEALVRAAQKAREKRLKKKAERDAPQPSNPYTPPRAKKRKRQE